MIRSNLNLFLWGSVIVAVDIRVEPLDIAPDFLGYAFILGATIALGRIERAFATAVPLAVIALFVSIPNMSNWKGGVWDLLQLVEVALQILIVWYVCTGVMHLASTQSNAGLFQTAVQQRTLSFVAGAAAVAVGGIARFSPTLAMSLSVLVLMLGIVAGVLLLLMLRRAARELSPGFD